jgi:hypothetical protein
MRKSEERLKKTKKVFPFKSIQNGRVKCYFYLKWLIRSFALDLFAPPGVEIGFLFGFFFVFFSSVFLFSPAFLSFSRCFWGSLCPCLGLSAFGVLQPSA